jgi:membrane associated rhomboid family serine protease
MFASIPPVTQALLILNAAVFVAQGFLAESLFSTLALWPADSGFAPWQLLTYAFLHGNILHLFVNMYALVMFGRGDS